MVNIKDKDLIRVGKGVRPDSRKRIILPGAVVQDNVTYFVYHNRFGQIVLDPQVTIPAYEAWLFNNPKALALVQQGLSDAAQGKVSKVDLETL
jgi:hypothetical protein